MRDMALTVVCWIALALVASAASGPTPTHAPSRTLKRTAGSNTSRASAPLPRTPNQNRAGATSTAGSNTPKGSTPIKISSSTR